MNSTDPKYSQYGLVQDMLATADIIRRFQTDQPKLKEIGAEIAQVRRLLMTGEGSSRIFPAKSAITHSIAKGWPIALHAEGGRQALEYDLSDWAVYGLSNSGRTAEVIELFDNLRSAGHARLYTLTAFENTELQKRATQGSVLACGKENAVAATKSVIEQALSYRTMLEHAAGSPQLQSQLDLLADQFQQALTVEINSEIISKIANAPVIYWAGRNDGVAEELTLKTNEITRKPSDYLEGTYAVHGIEEVMNPDDALIWIDPYTKSQAKFQKELHDNIGLTIVAISTQPTLFPTIEIAEAGDLAPFVQMAAGWNLLVEIGIACEVNIDKPQRARKVGNEFAGD